MPTISPPTHPDSWRRRDECLAAIDRDGFTILPHLLPQGMIDCANAYIDECCARFDREERDLPRYTETNIVEHDPCLPRIPSLPARTAAELRRLRTHVPPRPG